MSMINKVVKVTDDGLGGHPIGTVGLVVGEGNAICSVLVAIDKDVLRSKWHFKRSVEVLDEVNRNSIFTIRDGGITYKGYEM